MHKLQRITVTSKKINATVSRLTKSHPFILSIYLDIYNYISLKKGGFYPFENQLKIINAHNIHTVMVLILTVIQKKVRAYGLIV